MNKDKKWALTQWSTLSQRYGAFLPFHLVSFAKQAKQAKGLPIFISESRLSSLMYAAD